jgi:transcription initiation factor TFIIIB Brf1 subunit/transcription initiation factor TFIIB
MGDFSPNLATANMLPTIGSMVECNVVHSLPDMIVVSFETQDQKVFQGALLCTGIGNSSLRVAPIGVGCSTKEDFADKLATNNPRDYKLESFFTLQRRHTYFQKSKPLSLNPTLNHKRQVRLRARRVVCHKCKNVCSESGRNAGLEWSRNSGFRELKIPSNHHDGHQQNHPRKRGRPTKISNLKLIPSYSQFHDLCVKTFTLVPKIKRLGENEIRKFKQLKKCSNQQKHNSGVAYCTANSNSQNSLTPLKIKLLTNNANCSGSNNSDPTAVTVTTNNEPPVKIKLLPCGRSQINDNKIPGDLNPFENENNDLTTASLSEQPMNLRRKRCAIGSMEDLWDETIFEDPTVVKLKETGKKMPNVDMSAIMGNFANEKAARKALKKARREARKITKEHRRQKKRRKKDIISAMKHSSKDTKVNKVQLICSILIPEF